MERIKKVVNCDRCGGQGALEQWRFTGCTCWKCGGSGKMVITEIVRNEKEQATYEKQKARREAKKAAEMEARRIENEKIEAERIAREEAREAERKANLYRGFAGNVGEKIDTEVKALYQASFEVQSFTGYGTSWMTIYSFEDASRRMIVWKTCASLEDFEVGATYRLKGTIKELNTYRENEQTILTRAKAKRTSPPEEILHIKKNQADKDIEQFLESVM